MTLNTDVTLYFGTQVYFENDTYSPYVYGWYGWLVFYVFLLESIDAYLRRVYGGTRGLKEFIKFFSINQTNL